jgi:hypothetical protein
MSGGVEEIGQSMVAPGLRMITSGLSFSNEQGDAGITGRGTARGMVTVRFGMPERRIFPEDHGPKIGEPSRCLIFSAPTRSRT